MPLPAHDCCIKLEHLKLALTLWSSQLQSATKIQAVHRGQKDRRQVLVLQVCTPEGTLVSCQCMSRLYEAAHLNAHKPIHISSFICCCGQMRRAAQKAIGTVLVAHLAPALQWQQEASSLLALVSCVSVSWYQGCLPAVIRETGALIMRDAPC